MTAIVTTPAASADAKALEAPQSRADAPSSDGFAELLDLAGVLQLSGWESVSGFPSPAAADGPWSLFSPTGFEAAGTATDSASSALSQFLEGLRQNPLAVSVQHGPGVPLQGVSPTLGVPGASEADGNTPLATNIEGDSALAGVAARDGQGQSTGSSVQNDITVRVDSQDLSGAASRIQRVTRVAIRNGQSSMRIQLDPPSLGTVEVDVHVSKKKLSVHFQVENDEVRSALLKQLPELRQALAGYAGSEEVTVDLRSSDGSGDGAQRGSHRDASGVDETREEGSFTLADLAGTSRVGKVIDLRG